MVEYSNRKNCKKCRYEKCLLAGMQPSLVNATLRKKVEREVKNEGVEERSWNMAADSTTGGPVCYTPSSLDTQYCLPDQELYWSKDRELPGLYMNTEVTEERYRLIRSLIVEVFSKSNSLDIDLFGQEISSSSEDTYTIPISYLSLNTIASLNHGELVYIDMLVRRQEEMIAVLKERIEFAKQEVNVGEMFFKVKETLCSVAMERNHMAISQSRSCYVWAIVTCAVSEHQRIVAMTAQYITDQGIKAMQEVGSIIKKDKRLEGLYLSAILKGYEDPSPLDMITYYGAMAGDGDLTCEQTLNMLYRYLRLTQGMEGADTVFLRLRDIVRQIYALQHRIFV